jgi:hypothetical protein
MYVDKHGNEIKPGVKLLHDEGDIETVFETEDGDLGFNASNEDYVGFNELRRELYPLHQFDLNEWEVM